jgi:carbonic anhydrase/acetyltransferase-like protein (isoleucine patch superfamily)
VSDKVLIGQGSIISEGCSIGSESIVAAGAVVLQGTTIPSGEVWSGNPATFMRAVTAAEKAAFVPSAVAYSSVAKTHKDEFAA